MKVPHRQSWIPGAIVVALVYLAAGVVTGWLAGSAPTVQIRNLWRLAAWAVSGAVLIGQFVYERRRLPQSPLQVALHVSVAAALGGFLLAAVGPVRAHWHDEHRSRLVLLSLVLWPVITGVPAFVIALVGGAVMRRVRGGGEPSTPA